MDTTTTSQQDAHRDLRRIAMGLAAAFAVAAGLSILTIWRTDVAGAQYIPGASSAMVGETAPTR